MPTDQEFLESDIWLAEQMGECVHEWYLVGIIDEKNYCEWRCNTCPKRRTGDKPYVVNIPRSKDLGAMANVALKIAPTYYLRPHINTESASTNMVCGRTGTKIYGKSMDCDDFPSPQHAAAWAIYLALREVKK